MSTSSVDWDSPTVVTGDWVSIERRLAHEADDEVIATIDVTVEGDEPVGVEVVDAIPASWEVVDIGVHPDYVPDRYEAEPSGFRFTATVEPGSPLELVYGVRLAGDGPVEPPDPPELEREWRPGDEAEPEAEDEPLGTIDLDRLEAVTESLGADALDDRQPEVWPEHEVEDGASGGLTGPAGFADTADGPGEEPADGLEFGTAGGAGSGRSGGDGSGATEGPGDRRADRAGSSLLGGDDRPMRRSSAADGPAARRAEADPVRPSRPPDGEALLEALADALESNDAPAAAVETVRRALAVEDGPSKDARLDHLQSRVEEFAAYAETLGGAIDEHGALDDFLSALDSRMAGLEDDVAAVEAAIDDAATEREELEAAFDDLADRVETVEAAIDDLADLRTDVDQLRDHHGDDVHDLEAAIDAVDDRVAAATDELSAEIDALGEQVDQWESTRERLAAAFGDDVGRRDR